MPYLLPIAAGGFIYIAASDLMPEIRKESNLKKSIISFGIFLSGIILMYAVKFLEH
jgi:zinc and cadmium transporter